MANAKEFRRRARESLQGKYGGALLACFVFSLCSSVLSGISAGTSGLPVIFRQAAESFSSGDFASFADAGLHFSMSFSPVSSLLMLADVIVMAPISIGFASYFLRLADRGAPDLGQLFNYFRHFANALVLQLLTGFFVFLWTLLFIVPGVIAALRYSMAPYILAEHPDMSPMEALRLSKEMMKGNCGRLFCLHLSFIGWYILSAFTLFIGAFFLQPYVQTADAHFFNEVSGKDVERAMAAQPPYYAGGPNG